MPPGLVYDQDAFQGIGIDVCEIAEKNPEYAQYLASLVGETLPDGFSSNVTSDVILILESGLRRLTATELFILTLQYVGIVPDLQFKADPKKDKYAIRNRTCVALLANNPEHDFTLLLQTYLRHFQFDKAYENFGSVNVTPVNPLDTLPNNSNLEQATGLLPAVAVQEVKSIEKGILSKDIYDGSFTWDVDNSRCPKLEILRQGLRRSESNGAGERVFMSHECFYRVEAAVLQAIGWLKAGTNFESLITASDIQITPDLQDFLDEQKLIEAYVEWRLELERQTDSDVLSQNMVEVALAYFRNAGQSLVSVDRRRLPTFRRTILTPESQIKFIIWSANKDITSNIFDIVRLFAVSLSTWLAQSTSYGLTGKIAGSRSKETTTKFGSVWYGAEVVMPVYTRNCSEVIDLSNSTIESFEFEVNQRERIRGRGRV